jgi:Ca2+-binding RTX toxin-like protein
LNEVRVAVGFGLALGLLFGAGLAVAHTWMRDGDDTRNNLEGHEHKDIIKGFGAADTIVGRDGPDELFGGDGADTIAASEGVDHVEADGAEDALHGHDGDDVIVAEDQSDFLEGHHGNDTLRAGAGNFDWVDADEDGTTQIDNVNGGPGTDDTCDVDLDPFSGAPLDDLEGGCNYIQ